MKNCPKCGGEIKDNAKFCRHCGEKIEQKPEFIFCDECGAKLEGGATFCDECGARLDDVSSSASSVTDNPWQEIDDDPWFAIDNQVKNLAKNKEQEYLLGMECDANGQSQQAFEHFKTAAQFDHAEAQYMLAECYRTGNGTHCDRQKAREWFFKSAQNGSCAGMVVAGEICQYTDKNVQQAKEWYQKAATQNHADGVVHLAELIFNQDKEQYEYATEMLRDACRTHNKVATKGLYNLCMAVVEYLEQKLRNSIDRSVCNNIQNEISKYESLAKIYK